MEYIAHRINTLSQLADLPTHYGVEIDLRDRGSRLILEHDPFSDGEDFETYAEAYQHGTMILNIKSERVEHRVLEILKKNGISNYFFLDSSFPMIQTLIRQGEHNIAVRFSELEPIESSLALSGMARWVWVDCFTRMPLDHTAYTKLRDAGFKICLVSPDLLGRTEDIAVYKKLLADSGIVFDAICAKRHNFHLWNGNLL